MKDKNLLMKEFVHSPFRYQGHQTYALGSILSNIPEHQVFIEPFCGGAGVFFGKTKVKENWLNDINSELIETYKTIRDKPEYLIDFISSENFSKEKYNYFKTEFTSKNSGEIAARWFYLNRASNLENMDKFWELDESIHLNSKGLVKIILDCSKKLQGVKLTSGDFEQALNNAPDNAFLLIAPPYSLTHSSTRTSTYKFPFKKEGHLRILNFLKQNTKKVKFLLTYRDCSEIREMYSWGDNVIIPLESDNFFVDDITKKTEDQIKKEGISNGEVAIMNYTI